MGERALAPGCQVTTDGLLGFEVLGQMGHTHHVVLPPRGKTGTCHAFRFRKYAARYLADVQYRFNRRFQMADMVPRLAVALLWAKPCTQQALQAPVELGT